MTSLIVGLGSPHGDDQAGWLVIARLLDRGVPAEVARAAAHPTQIWDWWEPGRILTICDLSVGDGPTGTIRRRTWPHDVLPAEAAAGTHDVPLAEVLEIGVRVKQSPREVVVWTISGETYQPTSDPASTVVAAAQLLADTLWEQICGD